MRSIDVIPDEVLAGGVLPLLTLKELGVAKCCSRRFRDLAAAELELRGPRAYAEVLLQAERAVLADPAAMVRVGEEMELAARMFPEMSVTVKRADTLLKLEWREEYTVQFLYTSFGGTYHKWTETSYRTGPMTIAKMFGPSDQLWYECTVPPPVVVPDMDYIKQQMLDFWTRWVQARPAVTWPLRRVGINVEKRDVIHHYTFDPQAFLDGMFVEPKPFVVFNRLY